MLHGEGIELLVDLIVGLPGDTPDDVLRGNGLPRCEWSCAEAQVFPALAPARYRHARQRRAGWGALRSGPALPGTANRDLQRGCVATDVARRRGAARAPPGRVARRTWLVPPRGVRFTGPSAQHVALWFRGPDLFARRAEILRAIDGRLRLDPYAMLDVVLCPQEPFPLDLLDLLRAPLPGRAPSYVSRALAHRGEDLQRRISIVLRHPQPRDWVDVVRGRAQVFQERTARDALREAEELGATLPGARITAPSMRRRSRSLPAGPTPIPSLSRIRRWSCSGPGACWASATLAEPAHSGLSTVCRRSRSTGWMKTNFTPNVVARR